MELTNSATRTKVCALWPVCMSLAHDVHLRRRHVIRNLCIYGLRQKNQIKSVMATLCMHTSKFHIMPPQPLWIFLINNISNNWVSAVGVVTRLRIWESGVKTPVGRFLSSPSRSDQVWSPPSHIFDRCRR